MRRVVDQVVASPDRFRKLRGQLDELADIQWWHPAWWGLVGATALFEQFGSCVELSELYPLFLSADGGPRTDTFMGRQAGQSASCRPARIARAVVQARVAVEVLTAFDGTLPQQPLCCFLGWENRWLRRRAVADPRRVAFLCPEGAYLGRVVPGAEFELARALATGSLATGPLEPIRPESPRPTHAAIAVSTLDAPLDIARHIHRQVWTRGGGPWLGIGSAPPYEVVTTCHLVIDGYGHGRITAELFRKLDALADLEVAITDKLSQLERRGQAGPDGAFPGSRHIHRTGVASALIQGRLPFAAAAYAFGRAVAHIYQNEAERNRARYSPTFQVPIAPRIVPGNGAMGQGGADDVARRRRRVVHGLMALHMSGGEFESFDSFRARLPALIEREMAGQGVLTRLMQAAARAPVPTTVRRRYLAAPARPSLWTPPTEILAGRGDLSSLRFGGGECPTHPIVAVSSPPLESSPRDPRGGVVLTLVHHDGFATATASGTGLAATHRGAERILAEWLEQFERLCRESPLARL